MIVVTIEIWPHGDMTKRRFLGRAEIANDGTGDIKTGNYRYLIRGKSGAGRRGEVKGFPRTRLNAWQLFWRCMKDAYGKKP